MQEGGGGEVRQAGECRRLEGGEVRQAGECRRVEGGRYDRLVSTGGCGGGTTGW